MTTSPQHDLTTPPVHLVEAPTPRGFGRFSVGTTPFNAVAIAALLIMSAFVVLSPDTAIGLTDGPIRDAIERASAREDQGSIDVMTESSPPASSAPAPTTTEAPSPTTIGPPAPRPGPTAQVAPARTGALLARSTRPAPVPTTAPPALRAPRCLDFARQPDAQAFFDVDPILLAGFDGDGDGIACEQLPGRPQPPAPAAAAAVPTKQELLRPSTRLYGVHTPLAPYNMNELDAFSADAGKAPNTVMFFQNFSQDYPAVAVANAWSKQMLPVLTLEPIVQNSATGQPKLSDIANGTWDAYLNRWANAAKAQNLPVALRFGQEMNGNWYSWSDGRFGNKSGDFVRAWRHIHDLFDAAGADNIIWVWSVNRVDNLPDKTLGRVYPGDNYVDWVGISGYLREATPGVTPTFDGTFAKTLAELRRVAPNKLVMLTEVGAGTTESNRTAWIQSFFAALLEHPEIIGFSWFNDFKSGGDWRIQYSGATTAAFAAGVADPRYGPLVAR